MSISIAKPSPALAGIVQSYWTLKNSLATGEEYKQRIVPSGLIEITFYFDSIPESLDKTISINDHTVVTGQLDKFYDLKIKQPLSLFSIIFKPSGLSALIDLPINELMNQNIPLNLILKDETSELESRLNEAHSFEKRIARVENFILEQLKQNETNYHRKRITESIKIINQTKGLVSTNQLAAEACFSRKQFERVFSGQVGTSPKRFLNIVRFQHAVHEMSKNINHSLTSLSYACGYYDQSHMTREFIKHTGMSPKQYFKNCDPYSDYFQ